MTITPSDAEVIADAIDSALIDVHVALPGCVQSYDATTQTATIQLQVKRVLPTDDPNTLFATEDLPVLENVPVEFLRSKAFAVTMPLSAGDYGLVVFSEMSLDQWRSKGTNTSPGDIGRHTLTGGVFRPGLNPNKDKLVNAAHPTNMVVGLDDDNAQIHVTPAGSILIGADATKRAAREGDAVSVTVPALTFLVAATAGVLNPDAVVLDGEITEGSDTVKVSD